MPAAAPRGAGEDPSAAAAARGYSRCYPWDRGRRWDLGVRRGRGHRGSRERQRCRERPARGRGGREEAARPFLPRRGTRGTRGTLTVAPLAPGWPSAPGLPCGERRRKRKVTAGPAGSEAEGQGALGCHSQRDRQRQQGRGDRARHEHLGDLRCHERPGDLSHPEEEEEEEEKGSDPPSVDPSPATKGAQDTAGDVPACATIPGSASPRHRGHPCPAQSPPSPPSRAPQSRAGPTLAPAAPGKPGGPAGPVGP